MPRRLAGFLDLCIISHRALSHLSSPGFLRNKCRLRHAATLYEGITGFSIVDSLYCDSPHILLRKKFGHIACCREVRCALPHTRNSRGTDAEAPLESRHDAEGAEGQRRVDRAV